MIRGANDGQDQSLERCFGVKKNVEDCDWEYLKTVKMTQEPHEPVPRFSELLEYLAQPGSEHVWAFLDVKVSSILLYLHTYMFGER